MKDQEVKKKSLKEIIDHKIKGSKLPNEIRMTMQEKTQVLKKTGILDQALKVGSIAPDFVLPSYLGNQVKLSEKLKNGPVILTFYRGEWCPYCNLELRAYQELLPDIKKLGAELIAVSPESIESSNVTVNKNDVKFEVLTDSFNKVASEFGIVFKLDDEIKEIYLKLGLDVSKNQKNNLWELPIPATYVIGENREIMYSYLDVDYTKRAEPGDVIEVLKALPSRDMQGFVGTDDLKNIEPVVVG